MGGDGATRSWLDLIERAGNALPHPATLFALGAVVVVFASECAVRVDWSVERRVSTPVVETLHDDSGAPIVDPVTGDEVTLGVVDPATGQPVRERGVRTLRAKSLLSSDGLYWTLSSMVQSFVEFPPLGVVLVGMLGIGVAERSGLVGAALKGLMLAVPPALLTPTMVLVGVLSSLGLDAGYVVLPPVAAALYAALGRSPLVGLAAVFSGVAGGFGANLVVTSLDPLLAGLSTEGARLLDDGYSVAASANLYFMIASTVMLTTVGWATTSLWVEPRMSRKTAEDGGPSSAAPTAGAEPLSADERRGLAAAGVALVVGVTALLVATWIPGAPLYGVDGPFPRWIAVIVPLLFLGFLIPGVVYGAVAGTLRSDEDAAGMMSDSMAGMGSYIVLAFFAAQFIAYFKYSGLGEMLAISGGAVLASAALPAPLLMVGFVFVAMAGNLFIGSMSAKYAFFAPVFVPMFMAVGISPELTQVAYRIGDSVTNVITPLNPYMVIVLAFVQRHAPRSGIGTLVALMLPYTVAFTAGWLVLLVGWMLVGADLGPAGPLAYTPPDGLR